MRGVSEPIGEPHFVVIGSNSFSGSHFVAELLERGHRVTGLSRSAELASPLNPYFRSPSIEMWRFLQVDLNDSARVREVLNEVNPTHVVNFAAQSMVGQSWDYPEHWYRTNVVAVAQLAQTLSTLGPLQRYVHVTTPEVYGSTEGWIKENEDFRPSTPYAISRAAGDQHLLALCRKDSLPISFTRAANVYGPGQPLYRIVPRALLAARLGDHLTLDGGGTSVRSFIHIRDVAEATYRIATSGAAGSTYHLSTRETVTIRELAQRIAILTGVDWDALVIEGPERPGKDAAYLLDSSFARASLGWDPRWTLEMGLQDTLNWVDEHLGALSKLPTTYEHKE